MSARHRHLAGVSAGTLVEWTDDYRKGKIARWIKWNGRGHCLVELENGEHVYTRGALLKLHKPAPPPPLIQLTYPPPAAAATATTGVPSKVFEPPMVMPIYVADLLNDSVDDATSLEHALFDGEHDPIAFPLPRARASSGHIYVFYDTKRPGRCMVGGAVSVDRRLREARALDPTMNCFMTVYCPRDHLRVVDTAHAMLSCWRISEGASKEWFNVDPNEAAQACLRAQKILSLAK